MYMKDVVEKQKNQLCIIKLKLNYNLLFLIQQYLEIFATHQETRNDNVIKGTKQEQVDVVRAKRI